MDHLFKVIPEASSRLGGAGRSDQAHPTVDLSSMLVEC